MSDVALGHLVCLHGFTGSGESWREFARLLDASAGPLATSRVFAPELSGHGAAPLTASFGGEIDRLWSEIDGVWSKQARVILVGYSLGARVALQMLRSTPLRVGGALLIGVHPGLANEDERASRRATDAKWIRLLQDDGMVAFAEAWQNLPLFASQRRLCVEELQRQAEIRASHRAVGLGHSLRTFGLAEMPEAWQALRHPQVPIVLLAGGLDRKFSALAEQVVATAEASDSCGAPALEVVDGVGHNVLLERPEAVVSSLSRLLERTRASKRSAAR